MCCATVGKYLKVKKTFISATALDWRLAVFFYLEKHYSAGLNVRVRERQSEFDRIQEHAANI